VISNRVQLASLPPDELWQRLVEYCQKVDKLDFATVNSDDLCDGYVIADALAKFPDQAAGEALRLIRAEAESDWLQVMAVRLVGMLRLEAGADDLIRLFEEVGSWASEVARWSLGQLGTDAVIQKLVDRYHGDPAIRLDIADQFVEFKSDFAGRKCLELLSGEPDEETRPFLALSALTNFVPEAIEPARQLILTSEKSVEILDVREALLNACKLLEVSIPEFQAWLDDSAHDAEFRREWYESQGLSNPDDGFNFGDDWEGEEHDHGHDHDFESADLDELGDEAGTIVRDESKVGRNDPCPCGSGKKYKKCCLHKATIE
jgi:hypothetical protein